MDKDTNLAAVIAGLAVGVLLIFIVALLFKPTLPLSDSELIESSKDIKEVQFFLSKYPEAKPRIERYHDGSNMILVVFGLEKDVYEPAFDDLVGFGRTRELALVLEYNQSPLVGHSSMTNMYIQCGGPISTEESGNVTKLIEEYSWCIEKRLATNIYPKISRVEALEFARVYTLQNLVPLLIMIDFKEAPNPALVPENKTLNPLIYVAENGTHFLVNETNNYGVEKPCNLSEQQLCYTGDRDSQPFVIGHLAYVLDVVWEENEIVGGGTRYAIDANTGKILYPVNQKSCGESLEHVKTIAPFMMLLPTELPAGYSLQSVDYVPHVAVTLQYFTRSVCDPDNPYSPEEGVIEIVEGPLNQVSDLKGGKEYVQREMEKYEATNINATSYVFQDGRMHAVGYWDETYLKAHLWVVDDKTGTIVKIEARSLNTPLEQLAMIARSLKE